MLSLKISEARYDIQKLATVFLTAFSWSALLICGHSAKVRKIVFEPIGDSKGASTHRRKQVNSGRAFFRSQPFAWPWPKTSDIFSNEIFGLLRLFFKSQNRRRTVAMATIPICWMSYSIPTIFAALSWRVFWALEYGMVGINEGIISSEGRAISWWCEAVRSARRFSYGLSTEYVGNQNKLHGGLAVIRYKTTYDYTQTSLWWDATCSIGFQKINLEAIYW